MDECEALCHRLTIMVDGVMKCIGKIQYLKNRYGQGFTVMVKLLSGETKDLAELKSNIERKFSPNILLKDEHKVSILKLHSFINKIFFKTSVLVSSFYLNNEIIVTSCYKVF